jgi:hypothetical protein
MLFAKSGILILLTRKPVFSYANAGLRKLTFGLRNSERIEELRMLHRQLNHLKIN